jgi:hypothetical protein
VSAYLSECGRYRYSLTRDVAPLTGEGTCTFVMLNPSSADAEKDDPTVRRCIRFARDWGYARLTVVNLYAFRATDPRALKTATDPVGPENDHVLSVVFGASDRIVAAWGCHAAPERVAEVMGWPIRPRICLGLTKDGAPRHPLYVRADARLVGFRVSA